MVTISWLISTSVSSKPTTTTVRISNMADIIATIGAFIAWVYFCDKEWRNLHPTEAIRLTMENGNSQGVPTVWQWYKRRFIITYYWIRRYVI